MRSFLALVVLILARPALAAPGKITLVGNTPAASPLGVLLRIRVAECPTGGQGQGKLSAVRSGAWVREQVEAARKVLGPHGIELLWHQEPFVPQKCELKDRQDRDALAGQVKMDRAVTVLVLRRVRDLDLPSYDLMGLHWRYGGTEVKLRGRRWLILTARARPPVLAHELCHYFELRHDPAGGNLMTPGPSDPVWSRPGKRPRPFAAVLTRTQAARLTRAIRIFLAGMRPPRALP